MNSLLICLNIVKRAWANKKESAALFFLPVVVIGLIGFAISRAAVHTPTAALSSQDSGPYALALSKELASLPDVEPAALEGADFVVRIPDGFSAAIEAGRKVEVSLSGKDSGPGAASLRQSLNRTLLSYYAISQAAEELAAQTGRSKAEVTETLLEQSGTGNLSTAYHLTGPVKDSSIRQALSSTVGFALVFIMVLVFNVMGTILEDKKKLTLARMAVSPIGRWEIIAGNLLGCLVLGLIQLIPTALVLEFLFKLPWGSSLFYLFLTLFCFLLAAIGLGIGLSGIVRENFNPTMVIATVIAPTSIIGGSFIPASLLPGIINKLGWAVPQKWVMESFQQILQGQGFQAIAVNLGILLVFALAFASFGLKTLKPLDE